jgi:hypothetical protein
VRKDKWVELRTLAPGMRFRFKSADTAPGLFQVCKVSVRCNWVTHNRDNDGARNESKGDILVEHVKGHWVPEEEEGLVRVGSVEFLSVVEYDGEFWQLTDEGGMSSCTLRQAENYKRKILPAGTLVRVVHGTFVEGYGEAENE